MQKFKTLAVIILFSTICFTSLPSFAMLAKPNGVYVEGGLGVSSTDLGLGDSRFAGNVSVGYKMSELFAIEGGLNMDGNELYDIVIKGMLPFSNGITLFGKVGLGMSSDEFFSWHYEPVAYFAGGVSYNLTPKLGIFIQESAVTEDTENNIPGRYFSTIGLNFIF
jgi:hypothetical protein